MRKGQNPHFYSTVLCMLKNKSLALRTFQNINSSNSLKAITFLLGKTGITEGCLSLMNLLFKVTSYGGLSLVSEL